MNKLINIQRIVFCSFLLCAAAVRAQLAVTVSPIKVTGQKVVIPLIFKNNFAKKVESARAAVFLLDDQGKMVGQSTKWVIGGTKDRAALEPNKEAKFSFVITATKPLITTNLTAQVNFSRVVMEGGKLADVNKAVSITPAPAAK